MLWLLDQVTDSEIILLRGILPLTREDYQRDASFREKHEGLLEPDMTHVGSAEEELEDAALKASYRQHLHDLGLLRKRYKKPKRDEMPELDATTGMMKANGTDVTRLGKMLLRYLDLIPRVVSRLRDIAIPSLL